MAQLFFRYGSMNSGKSLDIIKVAHNYEEQGKRVMTFTSGLDNRTDVGIIASRVGASRPAIPIYEETNVFDLVKQENDRNRVFCVLTDESQFLKKEHVYQLAEVVDELDIPVIAYGLKNDFQNELFEGSKYLLLLADKIEEVKTICWFCTRKATMVMRLNEGVPVYQGEQIQIGGNESYLPVCRKHYKHPPMKDGKVVQPQEIKEEN